MRRACTILLMTAAFAPNLAHADAAIKCQSGKTGPTEIYVIRDTQKKFVFFNQKTKQIQPICEGRCNWSYTENRIAFDKLDSGFIKRAVLNRSSGKLTSWFATGGSSTQKCAKIAMPIIAINKF